MNFIEYLMEKGYKPYRKIYENKKWHYIEDNKRLDYFSSCVPGFSDIRLIKEDSEFIYGLLEQNTSPTLIYPRPINYSTDQINRLLIDKKYEEILIMACKGGKKKGGKGKGGK